MMDKATAKAWDKAVGAAPRPLTLHYHPDTNAQVWIARSGRMAAKCGQPDGIAVVDTVGMVDCGKCVAALEREDRDRLAKAVGAL